MSSPPFLKRGPYWFIMGHYFSYWATLLTKYYCWDDLSKVIWFRVWDKNSHTNILATKTYSLQYPRICILVRINFFFSPYLILSLSYFPLNLFHSGELIACSALTKYALQTSKGPETRTAFFQLHWPDK